jgi:hypothetical protein
MDRPQINVYMKNGDVMHFCHFETWDWRIHNGVERLIIKEHKGHRQEIPVQNIQKVEVFTRAYEDDEIQNTDEDSSLQVLRD